MEIVEYDINAKEKMRFHKTTKKLGDIAGTIAIGLISIFGALLTLDKISSTQKEIIYTLINDNTPIEDRGAFESTISLFLVYVRLSFLFCHFLKNYVKSKTNVMYKNTTKISS